MFLSTNGHIYQTSWLLRTLAICRDLGQVCCLCPEFLKDFPHLSSSLCAQLVRAALCERLHVCCMNICLYMAAGGTCSKWIFSGQICVSTDTCAKYVTEKQNGGWILLECNFPPSLQDVIIIRNLRASSGTYTVSSVFLIWHTQCSIKPKILQWHFICCRLASVLGNLAQLLFSCYTPRSFSS